MVDIQSKVLTIIICTYNRNEIIKYCLESIRDQSVGPDQYNVLIVDNYHDEKNHTELKNLIAHDTNTNIIRETRAGLSHARNTGYGCVETDYVGYIDDDCMIPPDFVTRALQIIEEQNFDCFGGHIESWWLDERPRWMDDKFGNKPKLTIDISIIEEGYNWGGNIFFKKKALELVKGFDVDIGMQSNRIGYSAENRVQMKLREQGYIIGYDPSLFVKHLIGKQKYHLSWHLKAAYAEGRDGRPVFTEQYTIKAILKDSLHIPITLVKSTIMLIGEFDFYWQNWLLDCAKPIFRTIGKIRSLSHLPR